jgi:hypothetical protein
VLLSGREGKERKGKEEEEGDGAGGGEGKGRGRRIRGGRGDAGDDTAALVRKGKEKTSSCC